MKKSPIYIKSIEIENIKTFGEISRIDFEKLTGAFSQWTIILGDNGIGKSTLLHCIAWMKPDQNIEINEEEAPDLIINHQENESLERLVRKKSNQGIIKATFISGRKFSQSKTVKNFPQFSTTINIEVDKERKLNDVKLRIETKSPEVFKDKEVTIFCYSASRVLGNANITDTYMLDTIETFIEDRTILYDAEEILHTINYARLGASEKEKTRYESYFNKVKALLVHVLPDVGNIKDIDVTSPKLVDGQMKQGEILLSTKHGKSIPFHEFSLGYKTVISWLIDLSWRLFNKYPESNDPLSEYAIVIVDEIDLHLHPVWQRDIICNLSKVFPNVQFVASAHSPLMVQAAIEHNFAVLKFENESVRIVNEPEGVDGWRIDQILTSEIFGLESARGREYDTLMNRRNLILQKKKITNKECTSSN